VTQVRSPRYGWYALGLLATVNLLNYANRNLVPPVYDDLRARYHLADDELGMLGTAFLLVHALMTLPSGWAGDRYDRRGVVAGGLLLATAALAGSTLATGLPTLALSRAVAGLGTAAIVPVCNSILGELFAGPAKASRMSVFNLGLFLGGVVGFGVGAALGFPLAFLAVVGPGVVAAVLVARLDIPGHHTGPRALPGVRAFVHQVRALLQLRSLPLIMLSTTSMAFAASGYLAWLIDFLQKERGLSREQGTMLLLVASVGGLCGVLVGGRLADRLHRRLVAGRLVAIVLGMGLTVPCAFLCMYGPGGAFLYLAGISTLFFASWYHAPMAASVDDLARGDRSATAQGLVIFTMHLCGSAPAPWVLGVVSKHFGVGRAMLVATLMVAVGALSMARALPSFRRDVAAVEGGSPGTSSL